MVQRVVAVGDSGAHELGMVQRVVAAGVQDLRNRDGSESCSSRGVRSSGIRGIV
jgi:hypothetical protein